MKLKFSKITALSNEGQNPDILVKQFNLIDRF